MNADRFKEAQAQLVAELDKLFPGRSITVMCIAMRIEDMICAALEKGGERG